MPINWQSARQGEVLPWGERRRRWSWEEKARIVAESFAPDAVASAVARRHGLHRNQLYAWRKELRQAADAATADAVPLDFVPVVVSEGRCPAGSPAIEIELAGARVRVSPGADPVLLADVLRTLKALG
ncbi:IS66-like element accessory protein TnpA [Defluviicoccus vanus]|uniref:Transposase n=1 Tax=Defluviicoccus vanus TaxID=111831 RepID=A0A7H1N512_9PROT|nr:transposase [Defluviicoccus vanus]QNT68295.1 transposase [Defluviicoccus vanus]QNT68605.1 transposase [Defluviicoccus vanus]QNT68972.1 transposase [Defluviicoccus vanus]QNT69119.1 transposase [Defluviicoccus vanus]QNT69410.1 transposase [Defluviicoccus vanus]